MSFSTYKVLYLLVLIKFLQIYKSICHEIATQLTFSINLSLEEGIFPDFLKESKVITIFKKGRSNQNMCENFRLLSILSHSVRFFFKLVTFCLNHFLETFSSLHYLQY